MNHRASYLQKIKARMKAKNLSTQEDLENLLHPLILPAMKLELTRISSPSAESQLQSHFGGIPYFKKGEEWPQTADGKPLDFIFQIVNDGEIGLPEEIELVQFYYNWDEFPWETREEGWLVKIYQTLNEEEQVVLPFPKQTNKPPYCAIRFTEIDSLPDWEGIELYSEEASDLSSLFNWEEPWEAYITLAEKLVGEQEYQSQLGGYPHWVQGESTPKNADGEGLRLLLQIDSEAEAELSWGDVGLIYIFYDESDLSNIGFVLQCH